MLLLVFLCGIYSNAQDTGVSSLTLVEGTIDTSASSITYELCATTPITLKIVLENFDTTSDTISKVSIGITGVNSLTTAEYTLTTPP